MHHQWVIRMHIRRRMRCGEQPHLLLVRLWLWYGGNLTLIVGGQIVYERLHLRIIICAAVALCLYVCHNALQI